MRFSSLKVLIYVTSDMISFELKVTKHLELCAKLPTSECPLKSSVFLLQGCQCFFEFSLAKLNEDWYYFMILEVKNRSSKWKPCDIIVRAGFKNEPNFSLEEHITTSTLSSCGRTCIWLMGFNTLQSTLPSDYLDGNFIKFKVCFQNLDEHLLETQREMDDKCLQTGSYLNADVSLESMTEDMSKLLDIGVDHDAEIKCGQHSIKAHKNILCARSEVFKAMLQSDMVEGRTGVVEINDMDETYIQDFVRYLYTGAMPELIFKKAKVLYEAGDKYAVRSLMIRCSEYLQDTLSPENALECLALADAHSDEKLKNAAIAYSIEKKMFLQKDLWLPFCQSYPKVALEAYIALHEHDTENKDV